MKHFLANECHRANSQKRGGQKIIEWDALDPEARYAMEPAELNDADLLYDKRWAMELLDRAMAKLRAEFAEKDNAKTFDALKGTLTGAESPREELARQLGMNEGALKAAVHRLRQRYREVLRAEIAETVNSTSEVADGVVPRLPGISHSTLGHERLTGGDPRTRQMIGLRRPSA